MRQLLLIAVLLLPAQAALAQVYYAEQNYPPPAGYTQPQVGGNVYAGQPVYPPVAQPAYSPPTEQAQQAPTNQPRPSDYGQSVMTDLRQMNF